MRQTTSISMGASPITTIGRAIQAATTLLAVALLAATLLSGRPAHAQAPVGQGFNLNASDLRFIMKQILISERHAATRTVSNPCGTLVGSDPDQIPVGTGQTIELPWGLRTVDGSCYHLTPGQEKIGTADQVFPRLIPKDLRAAEVTTFDPDGPGPLGVGDPTNRPMRSNRQQKQPMKTKQLVLSFALLAMSGGLATAAPMGGSGPDNGLYLGGVRALAADGVGHPFVGGDFTVAGTNLSRFIAQANAGPGVPGGQFASLVGTGNPRSKRK